MNNVELLTMALPGQFRFFHSRPIATEGPHSMEVQLPISYTAIEEMRATLRSSART